jgi:hypothetical protein
VSGPYSIVPTASHPLVGTLVIFFFSHFPRSLSLSNKLTKMRKKNDQGSKRRREEAQARARPINETGRGRSKSLFLLRVAVSGNRCSNNNELSK